MALLDYELKQSPRGVLWKSVLRNLAKFTGKYLWQSLFVNKIGPGACNFIKKDTLAQVLSYEFCEISKNTSFYRRPLVAASDWLTFFLNKFVGKGFITFFIHRVVHVNNIHQSFLRHKAYLFEQACYVFAWPCTVYKGKLLSVIGKKIFIKSEIQKSLELLTPFMTEVVII